MSMIVLMIEEYITQVHGLSNIEDRRQGATHKALDGHSNASHCTSAENCIMAVCGLLLALPYYNLFPAVDWHARLHEHNRARMVTSISHGMFYD